MVEGNPSLLESILNSAEELYHKTQLQYLRKKQNFYQVQELV